MITTIADTIIFGTPAAEWGPLFWIGTLVLIVPLLSIEVRRLHDTGRSGWWILIGVIPCIGLIVLIVWCVQGGSRTSTLTVTFHRIPSNEVSEGSVYTAPHLKYVYTTSCFD